MLAPYSYAVQPLKEGQEFEMPKGIKLFETKPYGAVISYPFKGK